MTVRFTVSQYWKGLTTFLIIDHVANETLKNAKGNLKLFRTEAAAVAHAAKLNNETE